FNGQLAACSGRSCPVASVERLGTLMTQTNSHSLRARWLVAGGLALLTLIVYAQCVTFDFINFDDTDYVRENRMVLQGLSLDGVRWAFTTNHAANWHPLTWLSLMTDVSLFGS